MTEAPRSANPGDRGPAVDDFLPELYGELRRMAHRQLRAERPDHTLGTTALVHEAYLKLAQLDRMRWQNRAHFCAEASRAMRRVLVDYATRRRAGKRGGGRARVALDESLVVSDAESDGVLALHEALEALERQWPRHARVVECRFFAGMSTPEIAEALALSPATVKRDWQFARAWLNRALVEGPTGTAR